MATLKINLDNGFFASSNGCYVDIFKPTHVLANGWECVIDEDGTVRCESVREYADGEHSMRYTIHPNGFAMLTLKIPHNKVKTIRKGFVIPKGTKLSDGLIGLAGGHLDERYAYFRENSFQEFLDNFGLTAVKHEDPNQGFSINPTRFSSLLKTSINVISDGNVEKELRTSPEAQKQLEKLGFVPSIYAPRDYHIVSGATWAIVETRAYDDTYHYFSRVLYTNVKNVMSLKDSLLEKPSIAKYVYRQEQCSRLNALDGVELHTLADIKRVASEVKSIAPSMQNVLDEDLAKEFLESFDLTDGYRFMVETHGPMPNNSYADFYINVVRGDGKTRYCQLLKVATGFIEERRS